MENLRLSTSSVFEDARKQFNQSAHASRLQEKFRVKPYFEKFARLRLVVLVSSFFFNVFSALTASTLVFFFVFRLVPNIYVSGAITGLSLLLLESLKRLVTPSFFKDAFQFGFSNKLVFRAIFVLFLGAISVSLSYFGSKRTIKELKPQVQQVDTDSIRSEYQTNIRRFEQKQEDVKASQSWKGTLTKQGQVTYQKIEDQIQASRLELVSQIKEAELENKARKESHQQAEFLEAEVFASVTFLIEILFILCIWYLELYDYKSFKEFAKPDNVVKSGYTEEEGGEKSVATENNKEMIELAIKKAKANISAYKSKIIKGEGKTLYT